MKPIISKITEDWIKQNQPCREAVGDWWDKKERAPIKILELLIRDKKYDWANWFIVRVMTYYDYVSYAVFAAEQVIDIYEKEYPDDKRPREAIEAAKKCIKNPSKKNKEAAELAWSAAELAARSAAELAARSAAELAARSAWSAAESAWSAARSAAELAAESAWSAAESAMQLKILEYGMGLLKASNPG